VTMYLTDLEFQLQQTGLSIPALEADRSIIYILDAEARIAFCNSAWDQFASRNGGIGLGHLSVMGASIFDVTPKCLQMFYSNAYASVRKSCQPFEHDFECSSPETYRLFHMRILPAGGPYLCVENSIRIEEPHELDPDRTSPIRSCYQGGDGITVMCCHCRRVRRISNAITARWDWVPEYLTSPSGAVSHGLCGLCRRFFYPETYPVLPESGTRKLA